MFEEFAAMKVDVGETDLYVRRGGSGPPVLLLHGFPQTHVMWHRVAPALAREFTVVCPDLRGYGASGTPRSAPNHSPYAKRAMARDVLLLMAALGFDRFAVAGHDRGGRVAYRLALDHPVFISRLAVLDIIPTAEAARRADARLAFAFWPWSLLAQPAPLPERLIHGDPEAVIDDALSQWGTGSDAFGPEARAAYLAALRDPAHVHAICEEFRAAATLDLAHDEDDLAQHRRIACPVLALWAADSALDTWYADAGGPIGIWRAWSDDVTGRAIPGGHFFPEACAEETAAALLTFFGFG